MESSSTTREALKGLFAPRRTAKAPRPLGRPHDDSQRVRAVKTMDALHDLGSKSAGDSSATTPVKDAPAGPPNPHPSESGTGRLARVQNRWLPGTTNQAALEHDGRTSHTTMVYDGIGFHTAILGRELPGVRDNRHLWEKGIG